MVHFKRVYFKTSKLRGDSNIFDECIHHRRKSRIDIENFWLKAQRRRTIVLSLFMRYAALCTTYIPSAAAAAASPPQSLSSMNSAQRTYACSNTVAYVWCENHTFSLIQNLSIFSWRCSLNPVCYVSAERTHTHTHVYCTISRVWHAPTIGIHIFLLWYCAVVHAGTLPKTQRPPCNAISCRTLSFAQTVCIIHIQSVTLVVLSYPRVYLHHQAHCSLPLSASMLCSAFSLSVIATNNTPMCAKYTEPSFGCRNPKSFESDIVFTHALWPPIFARMCVRFGSCRFRVPSPAHTHTRVRSFIHCACRSGSRVHQQWLSFEQRVWLCEDARYTLLCENRLGFRIFQIYI